ncbi:MAG: Gfo/Idh/MocA family protein [Armatimonadota bacterium]
MALRMIQVGTGGHGNAWCRTYLPANVDDGTVEVVAAVDINPDALVNAREGLGLPEDRCYTDVNEAMDAHEADFCSIVVPPAHHEQIVDAALAHDLHILSEKPIADTLEASVRIAEKVKRAGRKMGVTMSHRFDQDKTTLRRQIRSGEWGELDYLVCRFTCNRRNYGDWGAFRHDIENTLMIEGAVHHLDLLMDMTGEPCEMLFAQTWNPEWGEFAGASQGMVMMQGADKRVIYEGAKTNAHSLNCWGNEYIRAECEGGTLILDSRELSVYPYAAKAEEADVEAQPIPLDEQPKWANTWLIEQFADWLNGGEAMATNVEANLQSVALIFSAIESSRTGRSVQVQDYLGGIRERVLAEDF